MKHIHKNKAQSIGHMMLLLGGLTIILGGLVSAATGNIDFITFGVWGGGVLFIAGAVLSVRKPHRSTAEPQPQDEPGDGEQR